MKNKGLLLAVSSLSGKYAIGDFSKDAYVLIDILKKNNFSLWQILPLNPIAYGNSPYQPYSSFAIDEIYISVDDLIEKYKLNKSYFKEIKSTYKTDYEQARYIKEKAILMAFENFKLTKNHSSIINKFVNDNPYIDEFTTFITLKELNGNKPWNEWDVFIDIQSEKFKDIKNKHLFAQMELLSQWMKIKDYANKNGVSIIGDIPFYVGYDSSDLYFHKENFLLDEKFNPTVVAGVPPDYFSQTGQRWGNPIYDWEYLKNNSYKFLFDRIYSANKLYDIIRLDHFRAFDSYWAINPMCPTAVDGEWRYPDGYDFFNKLYEKYPNIKIIAEDLGELRPEVHSLKNHFSLAGMRVLQFSFFEDELSEKRIEKENQVYYLSTHDNETIVEWLNNRTEEEIRTIKKLLHKKKILSKKLVDGLINYALNRKENMIILSASDILDLDEKFRMNKPGVIDLDNWTFKLKNLMSLKNKMEILK